MFTNENFALKNNSTLHDIGNIYCIAKWIYWRVEYLVICLKNSVGVILIWQNGK